MINTVLREARKQMNVLPIELAKEIGLRTEAAYYKKESGRTKFSVDEAMIISKRLEKSIQELFFNSKLS